MLKQHLQNYKEWKSHILTNFDSFVFLFIKFWLYISKIICMLSLKNHSSTFKFLRINGDKWRQRQRQRQHLAEDPDEEERRDLPRRQRATSEGLYARWIAFASEEEVVRPDHPQGLCRRRFLWRRPPKTAAAVDQVRDPILTFLKIQILSHIDLIIFGLI